MKETFCIDNSTLAAINKNATKKGFWDQSAEMLKAYEIPAKIALCHQELSEALEADRSSNVFMTTHGSVDAIRNWAKNTRTMEQEKYDEQFESLVKDTFEDELADTIIRVLDIAARKGIDIFTHIDLKMRYNTGRPVMHGGKKY